MMNNDFNNIVGITKYPIVWKYLSDISNPEREIERFKKFYNSSVYEALLNQFKKLINEYGLNDFETELLILWSHFGIKKVRSKLLSKGAYSTGTEFDKQLLGIKDAFHNRKKRKLVSVKLEFEPDSKGSKPKVIKLTTPLLSYIYPFFSLSRLIRYIYKIRLYSELFPDISRNRTYHKKFIKIYISTMQSFIIDNTELEKINEFIYNFAISFGYNWDDVTENPIQYIGDKRKPSQI